MTSCGAHIEDGADVEDKRVVLRGKHVDNLEEEEGVNEWLRVERDLEPNVVF